MARHSPTGRHRLSSATVCQDKANVRSVSDARTSAVTNSSPVSSSSTASTVLERAETPSPQSSLHGAQKCCVSLNVVRCARVIASFEV
jgi:hypothetical protein